MEFHRYKSKVIFGAIESQPGQLSGEESIQYPVPVEQKRNVFVIWQVVQGHFIGAQEEPSGPIYSTK